MDDDDDGLIALRPDRSGLLQLEALRPVALRAGRLAETLFGVVEADVIVVQKGLVWRGKPSSESHNDLAAAEVALSGGSFLWMADTQLDPKWSLHPQTQGENGVRFCAVAPIVLKNGSRLGALRVFDSKPRAYDEVLADRLKDLAAFVADDCDRLINHEAWVLRELFEHSPGFIAVFDGANFVYRMANRAYLELMGERPMIGQPALEEFPDAPAQGFLSHLLQVFKSGLPCVGEGAPMVLERTPGLFEQRYVDFALQPITNVAGQVSSIFLQGNDVTEEKRALESLRASKADLEQALAANLAIFDHSLDVICTISREGLFMRVSKHAVNVWGYTAQELIGQPFIDFVHPDDRPATLAVSDDIIGAGRPTYAFRNRYIHKNGSVVPISWSASWSSQHNALVCIARDMRETLAADEKLQQAQKMDAVGRLTGGVAHDFNNLLTVIIGGSETLLEEKPHDPVVRELARMIRTAAERGAELTSQLLAFARKQPLEPRPVEVNNLLSDMEGLLRRTLGETVELRIAHGGAPWRTMADPVQLELAVLNLAINARDAMPTGGKLTIETANVTLDKTYCKDNDDLAIGEYLMIAVTDNGEGMSSQTISQAFEPFFTTKATGKGTGLGLSMVHGFVKQSKGNIKIYSEAGVGTTLKLYLPRADDSEPSNDAAVEDPGLSRGSEHILLVEDDRLLREHARKQLVSLGYRVSVASSGPEALAMVEKLGDFDLLFTDVVMPSGVNGPQLAEQIRALKPLAKVLYTSGYSENAIIHHGRLDHGVDLLIKPYRKRELALKVRKVLEDQ